MFSVVIPAYVNNSIYLYSCLESCINNADNITTIDVLVVLNGVGTYNEGIEEKFRDRVRFLKFDKFVGYSKGVNHGVYNSKTNLDDLVLIIRDINIFPPHWDTRLSINGYSRERPTIISPNQVLSYSSSGIEQFEVNSFGSNPVDFKIKDYNEFCINSSANNMDMTGGTMPFLIRRKYFLSLGGFNEDYPDKDGLYVDYEFCVKAQVNGYDMLRTYWTKFYLFNNRLDAMNGNMIERSKKPLGYFKYKWGKEVVNTQDNFKALF